MHGLIAPPDLGLTRIISRIKFHALGDQQKLCPAYVRGPMALQVPHSRDGIYRLTGRRPSPVSTPVWRWTKLSEIPRSARSERTLGGVPITRGKRLVCDPAILSVILDASPAQKRILQLSFSSKRATGGRSPSRDAGRRAHWTGTSCRVCIPMSDRPTCLSSTCGLGVIKRFRSAARRQIRRIATAKQAVSRLARSEQFCFPFFLRPGNSTGRVVPDAIQYRK